MYKKEVAEIRKLVSELENQLEFDELTVKQARKLGVTASKIIDAARALHGQIAFDLA
ncbi:MAG: hypothetical protein JW936_03390 [Sedimentisphaerales bacterium]|nr:hypothetical protein [Sedimentisphaerales bacterium]